MNVEELAGLSLFSTDLITSAMSPLHITTSCPFATISLIRLLLLMILPMYSLRRSICTDHELVDMLDHLYFRQCQKRPAQVRPSHMPVSSPSDAWNGRFTQYSSRSGDKSDSRVSLILDFSVRRIFRVKLFTGECREDSSVVIREPDL